MFDCLPLTSALIALHLHLLENARREYVFLYYHAPSTAVRTSVHLPIGTASPFAFFTDLLFLYLKRMLCPVIEISKRYGDPKIHIGTPALATAMPKVATAAKEARKEVEGILVLSRSSLFVLIQALMTVLVVDAACFFVGQSFICFGNLDEFLLCGVIPPVVRFINNP